MMLIYWILTLVLLFFPGSIYSGILPADNNISFDRVEGIQSESINKILQDETGFIWIGTVNGLFRYDGYHFKEYRQNPTDPNSISGNHILALEQDYQGTIWIGTKNKGLNRYSSDTDSFTHYLYDPNNPENTSGSSITEIYEDGSYHLWIGTWGDGLKRLDRKTMTFVEYRHKPDDPNSLLQDDIFSMYEDREGRFWIGTNSGMCRYDRINDKFIRIRNCEISITSICEDRDKNIWAGSWDPSNIYKVDRETDTCILYKKPHYQPHEGRHITDMWADHRNNVLWIGMSSLGLGRLDIVNSRFDLYENDPSNPNSLSNSIVNTLYQDKSGILWVGTQKGLNKLISEKQHFDCIKSVSTNKNSLSNSIVRSICEDSEKNIWISTSRGLNRIDGKTGAFTHYFHDPNDPKTIENNDNRAIRTGADGSIYIGGYNTIDIFDPNTGLVKRTSVDLTVMSIMVDSNDLVWLGTLSNLLQFNPEKDSIQNHGLESSKQASSINRQINDIVKDRDDFLWIGTIGEGLQRYDPANHTFQRYYQDKQHYNGPSSNTIMALFIGHNGNLWIGSDTGLDCYDIESKTFNHIKIDEFEQTSVIGILEDDFGFLWLASEKCLLRFNPETKQTIKFDHALGLLNTRFSPRACCKCSDGRLLFGGMDGIDTFYPQNIKVNNYIPPIVFTSIHGSDREHLKYKNNSIPQEVVIPYNLNSLSFEFSAIDFANPTGTRYQYFMEGLDTEWHNRGTENHANYNNLAPGHYHFQVKASNRYGEWLSEGASVDITVIPPFWHTLWFRFLTVLSIVVMIAFCVRYRIHTVEKRRNELEKQIVLRTNELRLKSEELEKTNAKQRQLLKERDELIDELQELLNRIKVLHGLIPICSCCKKIRDDEGYWNQIDVYLSEHSDADFTHSICPDCAKELYPDVYSRLHPDQEKSSDSTSISKE